MKTSKEGIDTLIENLVALLNHGHAHVSLDKALADIPFELLGRKTEGLPYSIWQLAQHVRIAQADILEFSRNENYQSPKWPEGYWPSQSEPNSSEDWKECLQQIQADRKAFTDLLRQAGEEIYKPFDYGDGQSLLKEALVLADHNSYHTGEIIVARRLLGNWK